MDCIEVLRPFSQCDEYNSISIGCRALSAPYTTLVLDSLRSSGHNGLITIAVPFHDIKAFRQQSLNVQVVCEDELLGGWNIGRIRRQLGPFGNRAGWYL